MFFLNVYLNLKILIKIKDNFGSSQKHVISLKLVKLHSECDAGCCDIINNIPRMIAYKIFSYLDYGELLTF